MRLQSLSGISWGWVQLFSFWVTSMTLATLVFSAQILTVKPTAHCIIFFYILSVIDCLTCVQLQTRASVALGSSCDFDCPTVLSVLSKCLQSPSWDETEQSQLTPLRTTKENHKMHYWLQLQFSLLWLLFWQIWRQLALHQGRFAQCEHTDDELSNESSFRSDISANREWRALVTQTFESWALLFVYFNNRNSI